MHNTSIHISGKLVGAQGMLILVRLTEHPEFHIWVLSFNLLCSGQIFPNAFFIQQTPNENKPERFDRCWTDSIVLEANTNTTNYRTLLEFDVVFNLEIMLVVLI